MNGFLSLIARDLKLAARSGGTWAHGLVFFLIFLSICAIALGGDSDNLRPLAPALIWLALLLSLLLSFEHMFRSDVDDGSLEQMKTSDMSFMAYVSAKCCVQWLLSVLPIFVFLPLAAILLNLPVPVTLGMALSVYCASPALICYGAFSAACLSGYKGGGILIVLLSVPLLVPLLIFGIAAVTSFSQSGTVSSEFYALIGISLIAIAVGIPAASAALKTSME